MNGNTVISQKGNGDVESDTARYSKIERNDVAVAAVLNGAVKDNHTNPYNRSKDLTNTITVVDTNRTKLSATYLRDVEVDFKDGTITYTFNRNVEEIFDVAGAEANFGWVNIYGDTEFFTGANANLVDDIEVERSKVTIELKKSETGTADLLAQIVGAVVKEVNTGDETTDETKRVVPGFAAVERSFNAGEVYAPTVKGIKSSEYDEDDEILSITFALSEEMKLAANVDLEDAIILYDAEGREVDFKVDDYEDDDDELVVDIEIDKEDLDEVVLIVINAGAFESTEDYRKGLTNLLAVFPYNN